MINAVTGFHLWSKSYDRDLGDVLKLQTEIATAVASALKVTLLGDVAAKVELGGTRNPAAFNAYLWGVKEFVSRHELENLPAAITAYTEAIRLDPRYALAPGNAQVLRISGLFAAYMGRTDAGVAAARRALVLDPLARDSRSVLGRALYTARRYEGSAVALSEGINLDPSAKAFYTYRGFVVLRTQRS